MYFDSAYGMVIDTLKNLALSTGIQLVSLPIPYPLRSSKQLVDLLAAALDENPNVRLFVFSHISSMVCTEPCRHAVALTDNVVLNSRR